MGLGGERGDIALTSNADGQNGSLNLNALGGTGGGAGNVVVMRDGESILIKCLLLLRVLVEVVEALPDTGRWWRSRQRCCWRWRWRRSNYFGTRDNQLAMAPGGGGGGGDVWMMLTIMLQLLPEPGNLLMEFGQKLLDYLYIVQ